MAKKVSTTIYIEVAQSERLARMAAVTRLKEAEIIRLCIDAGLDSLEKSPQIRSMAKTRAEQLREDVNEHLSRMAFAAKKRKKEIAQ